MTDRVDRALRTLRETETGASSGTDETLERVLRDLAAARRERIKRARVWIPIAAVLAVSASALARPGGMRGAAALLSGLTGRSPPVPRGDPAAPGALERSSIPSAAPDLTAGPPPAPDPTAGPRPAPDLTAGPPPAPEPTSASGPVAVPVAGESTAVAPAATSGPERPRVRTGAPPSGGARPAPGAISAATVDALARITSSDAQLDEDVYTRAHALHFRGGDPAASIAAWDDYLRRFPAGRFVPEARYNRAVDLLRLGRYAEARTALAPFADGTYGGYHQGSAVTLLGSIPHDPPAAGGGDAH